MFGSGLKTKSTMKLRSSNHNASLSTAANLSKGNLLESSSKSQYTSASNSGLKRRVTTERKNTSRISKVQKIIEIEEEDIGFTGASQKNSKSGTTKNRPSRMTVTSNRDMQTSNSGDRMNSSNYFSGLSQGGGNQSSK